MMIGANSHHSVRSGQSETDLVGMDNDNFFNAVSYSFRSQLKSSGNPAHDKMAVKLRLSEKVNWLSHDCSDTEQRLTVKFLVNWCSAFLKDLKSYGTGDTITKLLEMRAQYPNILVDEKMDCPTVELLSTQHLQLFF